MITTDPILLLFLLIGGHFLADFPLQGEFLSKAKDFNYPISNVPWYTAMIAHATIHGTFVAIITGQWMLGIFEILLHFIIDQRKCNGLISFNRDQVYHILCKLLWWILAILPGYHISIEVIR